MKNNIPLFCWIYRDAFIVENVYLFTYGFLEFTVTNMKLHDYPLFINNYVCDTYVFVFR